MSELAKKLGHLCPSCGAISLEALLEAIPIPAYPRGGGCGVPNFFEFSIPQPLSFPDVEASSPSCALCSLIYSLSNTSTSGHLELAGLCPPSETAGTHDGLRLSTSDSPIDPFARYGEPQPQWYGFRDGEKRVNTLEPITERSGTKGKTKGYNIRSPWQINVAADKGSPASRYIPRRPLSKQGSEAFFEGLLRVIDKCNSSHPRCRLGVDGSPLDELPELPTRVIDVGSAEQRPRLVISHARRANYVTLSHCWGSQRWVATTTQSLPQMIDGFDLAAIPKTYADAIAVTRKLGIQFLWIDSFCIIQDDRDDWTAESQKMGDIYEKAYLNIAAAGAKDGKTGFLEARREDPIYVRVPAAGDQQAGYFYFTNQANSDFDAFVTRVKLNTRGWVLQERILSRRTIHFAADMWYWECGQHVTSEDGWQHDPRGTASAGYHAASLRQTLDASVTAIGKVFRYDEEHRTNVKGLPVVPTEVLWAQILRAYSKCGLSFSSDKLPALQGLVNNFKRTVRQPYVFGHWVQAGEPLPLSLMWFAATDGGLDFPADNLAPSWSCLKGNGAVEFHDSRGGTPCTRIDRVDGACPSMRVRGRLRTATLAHPNGEGAGAKPTFYSLSFKSETQYGTFTRSVGPARFDDAADVPKEVSLLLAYEVLKSQNWSNADKDQLALVLREVGGAESQDVGVAEEGGGNVRIYKRIGIANINNHSFFDRAPVSSLVIV
ncbi:hypothetical protein VTI74DRAFT_6426 [Chaetomium olivicolor]